MAPLTCKTDGAKDGDPRAKVPAHTNGEIHPKTGFWTLTLGSLGVVFQVVAAFFAGDSGRFVSQVEAVEV